MGNSSTSKELRDIWNQNKLPVVLRRGGKGQRIRLRLPYSENNLSWLQNGKRIRPEWFGSERYWEIPKTWFNDFVERALKKYGLLYVIQPYREQEKCSPSCLNAIGHECQCSCMGLNHGAGNDGSWFEVNEAFAVRWGDAHLSCKLMGQK